MVVKQEHQVFFNQANDEIRKFYNETGLDYIPSAEHRTHAEFAAKAQNRPIKRHIDQVHRVREGGLRGQEKMYFLETHTSKDHRGNRISKFLVNGKFDNPIPTYQYDEITGQNMCTGIDGYETIYQMPFNLKVIDELVDSGEIDDRTQFAVETPNGRGYGGFSFDEFRNMSFDDLVYIGKTGMRPEERDTAKSKERKNI